MHTQRHIQVCAAATALASSFGSSFITRSVLIEQIKALISDAAPGALEELLTQVLPISPAAIDALRAALSRGVFEPHITALAQAVFELLDVDMDGRVSREQIAVYTRVLLDDCESETEAKGRLMAIFQSLDVNGDGGLTQASVQNWLVKIWGVVESWARLWVAMCSEMLGQMLPQTLAHVWRGYCKYRKEQTAVDVTRVDAQEWEYCIRMRHQWWSQYAVPSMTEGHASENLWSTIFNDLVQVPGEDLLCLARGRKSTDATTNMPVATQSVESGSMSEELDALAQIDALPLNQEWRPSLSTGVSARTSSDLPTVSASGILGGNSRVPNRCLLGHRLRALTTPEDGWECDACAADPVPKGTTVYGCAACRWACCQACLGDSVLEEDETSDDDTESETESETAEAPQAQSVPPVSQAVPKSEGESERVTLVRQPLQRIKVPPLRMVPEERAADVSSPNARAAGEESQNYASFSSRGSDARSVGSARSSRSMRSVTSKLPGGMLLGSHFSLSLSLSYNQTHTLSFSNTHTNTDNPNVTAAEKVEAYRQYKEEETRRRADELARAKEEAASLEAEAAKAAEAHAEAIRLKDAEISRREAALDALRRKEADLAQRELVVEQVKMKEEALRLREKELEELAAKQADFLAHEAELHELRQKEAMSNLEDAKAKLEEAAAREREALAHASERDRQALLQKSQEERARAALEVQAQEDLIKKKEAALKVKEQEIIEMQRTQEAEERRRQAELENLVNKAEEMAHRERAIMLRENEVAEALRAADVQKQEAAAETAERMRQEEAAAAKRKRDEEKAEAAIKRREEAIKEAMRAVKAKEEAAMQLEMELQSKASKEMALLDQERIEAARLRALKEEAEAAAAAAAAEEKKRMEAVKAERELEAARLRAWKEEADAAAARAAEEKKMLADKAAAAERAAGEAAVILRVLIHDVRAGLPAKC